MSHVFVTRRTTTAGSPRYVVRYRWGGRGFPLRHLASKPTLREAKALRDWAAGEMIAGRDPRASLRDLALHASDRSREQTVDQAFEAFIAARLDTQPGTQANYWKAKRAFSAILGALDSKTLRVADIQRAIGVLSEPLAPVTLAKYMNTLRQVLDFAEVEPNVARDRRVKLPAVVTEEPNPPDADHVVAMLRLLTPRWRLAFVTAEQTGMRVGEIASVTWADVDVAGSRFRMKAKDTKSRARQVGAGARVADGRDRGFLPARGSGAGAEGLPTRRRGRAQDGDAARLQDGRDHALLAPRPAPSPDHDLASRGHAVAADQ